MKQKPPALPTGGGNKENLLYISFAQEKLMALLRYLAERHPLKTPTYESETTEEAPQGGEANDKINAK